MIPEPVGITVARLTDPLGGVRLTFSNTVGEGYAIELDPATALQLTLMMVNSVAVGTNVFSLEQVE